MREKHFSELRLGTGGSYKHFNKIYDNVLGIVIQDMLMNFFIVMDF